MEESSRIEFSIGPILLWRPSYPLTHLPTMTGRFSVSHEQSRVPLELCRGEEKLERKVQGFALLHFCTWTFRFWKTQTQLFQL